MQQFSDSVLTRSGSAVASASVLVKTYPGGDTATIYSDDGTTEQTNPITTDANGRFSFYAADGRYTLVISKTGYITQQTLTDHVLLQDLEDADADHASAADVNFTPSGTGTVSRPVSEKLSETRSVLDYIGNDLSTSARESLVAAMAAGTSTTDLSPYIQDAVEDLEGTGATLEFSPGYTYRIDNKIILTDGDIRFTGAGEIHSYMDDVPDDAGDILTDAVFDLEYGDGSTLEDIVFDGLVVVGKYADSADHFIFQSRGASSSNFRCRRVDRFKMVNCRAENIKLCCTYGENFVCSGNVAHSDGAISQNTVRNSAIIFNNLVTDTDLTWDTVESGPVIVGNSLYGYGGGIMVHSYFDNADESKRPIRGAVITGNRYIGYLSGVDALGHFGIYCGSILDPVVVGNYVANCEDLGIDLEFCEHGIVDGNRLYNASLANLWGGKGRNQFTNNIVVVDDTNNMTTDNLFVQSATVSETPNTREIILRGNQFINNTPSTLTGQKIDIATVAHSIILEENIFRDVAVAGEASVNRAILKFNRNDVIMTVAEDRVPVALTCSGHIEVLDNKVRSIAISDQVYTPVSQSTTNAAIRIVMWSGNTSPTLGKADEAWVKRNFIHGWTNSWDVVRSGSSHHLWHFRLEDNEYDGNLKGTISGSTGQRILLKNNRWHNRATPALNAAHPATPAAAVATNLPFAKGSEINFYDDATTAIKGYRCITASAATSPPYDEVWVALPTAPSVNTTGVGNVGTGEDNLMTYSLPASTLFAAKCAVRITAWGTAANNANAKTLKLYFGSVAISSQTLTTSQVGDWEFSAIVISTGTDAQDYTVRFFQDGSTQIHDRAVGTLTQDDGAAITIKCTGTGTADNDIVQEGLIVEVLR